MTSADLPPPRERASRRDIIKLMRGDIIKIIAPKTVHPYHLKTFFIDYIDATQIRAMTADAGIVGRVLFQLDEETGMFADAEIVAIELLSRSPEPGYARQRGFVKGAWIEIHFQEQGVSGLVVGKVFSLESGTDCIGVSIFNPADPSGPGKDENEGVAESEGDDAEHEGLSGPRTNRIYIDFEFKGLSDELHIREIRICDEPDAAKDAHLKHAMSTRPIQSDEPEEGEGKRDYDSNDEGTMPPPPQADEAVQSRAIRDGDLVFGDDLGEAELYVQVPENMRRHDLDVQQTSMLEELLSDVPTDRRTVGALKSIHTMIERYTQLRALFSTEDARGNIARTPEYTDDYKPLAEFLITMDRGQGVDIINIANPFRDWLVPIYVQRRKIYAIEDDEMGIFEANVDPADAYIMSMPVQLRKEAGLYAQYYKRANKTFSDFATDIRMHTTPFTEPGNSVRSQFAFDFIATSCTNPQLREIPAYGARSVKINAFSTHMNTARYLELDRIPSRASAYMALPMPVVMLSLYKQPVAQIIDQTHANYVTGNNHCYSDLRVWNMGAATGDDAAARAAAAAAAAAAAGIKTRPVLSSGAMSTKDLASNHLHFLSGREILVPNHRGGSARDANVFTNDAIRNMVPSTGDLFHNLVKPEFENRSVTLSPRIMVSALSPFLVQQQHITHTLFSDFSNFIGERVNSYKDDCLTLRTIHDAFASHKYGADPIGINAMYAMVLHNQTSPSSAPAFDATVVAKYGIHEWAVRSGVTCVPPANPLRRGACRGRILTSSELLSKFLSVDYGRCFMNEVVLMNKTLFGIDVGGVLSKYADESNEYVKTMKTADANAKGKCKNFVLAKEYLSLDDLETDNQMQEQGIAILYDQRYDPTDYEFLTKYEQKERSMPGAEFKTYLIGELMKKPKGLSATDAALEADSITARARHVQTGDHAVVIMQRTVEQQREPLGEDPIEDKPAYYYYRLTKPGKGTGKWVRDASIPDDVRSDDSSYFCNVHPECIQLKAHCMSLDTAAGQVNSSVLTSMSKADLITKVHQEFDTQFEVSSTNFAEYMKLKEAYDEYRMTKMRLLQRVTQTAQNNRDFLLGTREAAAIAAAVAAGAETVISPHVGELNAILGDGSFARKQTRIIMFVTKYTRSNQSGDSAGAEWLHCAQSGAKLLPAWLYRKAAAYIQPQSNHIDSSGGGGKSYLEVLDQICKEYGRPEGDSWVDCKTGSGMVIKRVNFSHDEGYDEEGSKITTHSVLELDKARAAITPVVQEALSHSITDKLKGPHSHKINDVVQRVLTLIGIKPDRNGLRERIIVSVIDTMETTSIIASEAAFTAHKQNIKSEAGRTMAYDGYFNNMIVNISLAHIVIALQCAIPDIRPKKTFAGCEKSFGGFPLDDGGNGCIKYISCVAASVKNQINNVWSYFKNKPATIEGSVTALITSIMASSERIRAAIKDKRLNVIERSGGQGQGQGQGQGEYAEAGMAMMMIPETLTTTKWKHFFPLLHSLDDLRSPEPLPEHLKQAYLKDLRTCRAGQRDTHEVLRFKLMEYSLHIQKCIQEIVSREGVLTLFSGETPSTENACCEELLSKSTSRSVIQYFASRNRLIGEYNTAVKCLNNIMLDVTNISRASMMCSLENTRVSDAVGTGLPSEFSEDTIYKGFVSFCRMDKNIPVLDATVLKLAGEKPVDYSATDEWPDKFRKLKSAHATGMSSYTTETFSTLLDKVNAASIVGEPGSGSGSGSAATVQSASTPGAALLDLLNSDAVTDHVNENVEVMSEPLRERLVELLAPAAATAAASGDEETECYVMLTDENRGMWTYINGAVREQMSVAAATATGAAAVAANRTTINAIDNMMTFLKTVDRFETETANAGESKSLRFSFDKKDETTVKYAQFIKSGIRFMLSVVPGLLVSSASASGRADEIIISKHWKFSEKHENDVADIMTNQNAGLREFYENPQIGPCMTQFMTLDDDQSLCATIVKCVNAVPFIETPAISRRVIQQLYKYFFLRVVKLYAFFITNPTGKINVGIALSGPRMVGAVGSGSVGGAIGAIGLGAVVRDASRLVAPAQAENESISNSSFMSMLEQTSNAKRSMRELLTAVVGILSQNKADINKTVSDVMKRTNRLKLNEKDQMRKNLKQLSQEHRTVVNELKDLRIGVWNVGSQIAKYDKARQDQEMDAMAELEAMNAVEGTATTAAAEYNDAVDFGPDELDRAIADASESRADVDGYSAFPAGEGDDYELDQGMRNEVGITTSC